MKLKVTIGVCVRNCEDTIARTIKSVMHQTYPHELMEIIFVDDGSEDRTLSIIKKHVKKMDIKAKVFHTTWRGLGAARNTVVKNASGEYIIWVDGDEELERKFVEKQVKFLEANPKIGITVGIFYLPKQNVIAKLEMLPFVINRITRINEKRFLKLPGTGGAAFRIQAIKQVGGFDETLKGAGEDIEIAYRIRKAGWLIGVTDARYYERRGNVKTLRELWNKYLWYGYGNYKVYVKHKGVIEPAKMTPLAGIIAGALYAAKAYPLIREKRLFLLLPATFFLKFAAWCIGFTLSSLKC